MNLLTSGHQARVISDYLDDLLNPEKREATIVRCVEAINKSGVEFEAVAFTGVSGALIGPALADALGKSMIVVRKRDDTSTHSSERVEGDAAARRYIIADDLVDSGRTIVKIVESINEWSSLVWIAGDEGYKRANDIPHECVGVITAKHYLCHPEFLGGLKRYRNLGHTEGSNVQR